MKRGYIIASVVAVVALLFWWVWPRGATSLEPQVEPDVVPAGTAAPVSRDDHGINEGQEADELEVSGSPLMTRMLRERRDALERVLDDWRTPIEFYGKVVDENSEPMAEAQVRFSCNDLSPEGTSFYETTSDADGLFSINEIQGLMCDVEVSKPGYYKSRSARQFFYYAGLPENFVPNRLEPVVFHLRRHGAADPLVAHEFPGFGRLSKLRRDGTPVYYDLRQGTTNAARGHLRLELVGDPITRETRRFNWLLRITAEGGLLETSEEFPFLAPTGGYQPSLELGFSVEMENGWQTTVTRSFYVLLNEGLYARFEINLLARNGVFTIRSFLNPTGSRNLEYRPPPPAAPRLP